MKESERILKLFKDLYNGTPWLEITLTGKLSELTAEQAARRIMPNWNTIWEIVQHLISWRQNVLQRVQGVVLVTPENNYFTPLTDTSPEAWKAALDQLEETQNQWISFLQEVREVDMLKTYPGNEMSYYDHIIGILEHDAYHLGQISLLAKAARSV